MEGKATLAALWRMTLRGSNRLGISSLFHALMQLFETKQR
jgi:hypothetical protein